MPPVYPVESMEVHILETTKKKKKTVPWSVNFFVKLVKDFVLNNIL